MSKILLVDGDNILVRGIKAMEMRLMSSDDGVNTGALVIFINSLARHIREERPDRMVVCWDGGRSRFRAERSGGTYKANRAERTEERSAPEGPYALAKRFLALANVTQVERAGWEADDLIAAYVAEHGLDRWDGDRAVWHDVVVLSSDRDLLQLVGEEHVTQVKVATGDSDFDRWDAARVREHYGIPDARHLHLVKGLAGDPGDGVPGLPGIAEKKAVKLLAGAGWEWERLMDQFDAEGRVAPGVVDEATEQRGPDRSWREVAELTFDLVDLLQRPWREMGLVLAPPGDFRPTRPGDALYEPLDAFLDRYDLRRVQSKLALGELWPTRSGDARED